MVLPELGARGMPEPRLVGQAKVEGHGIAGMRQKSKDDEGTQKLTGCVQGGHRTGTCK